MIGLITVGVLLGFQIADRPAIEVGEDHLVNQSGPALPLAESHLSSNPKNPNHLLAGVIQIDGPDWVKWRCISWASFDGGQQWTRHEFPVKGCADPWGVILPDGSAIMVMLGMDDPNNNLYLFRSPDGGRNWPEVSLRMGAGHDHPMVVAQGDKVYVVSGQAIKNNAKQERNTVFVTRSEDGGKTFGPPTKVTASNLSYEAEGPVLLSDGALIIGFNDHDTLKGNKPLVRPRIWLLRSNDQGRTFSEPLLVSESCEGAGGWPSMAVDASDHLFWTCIADHFNGVLIQRSDDRGESWGEPLRINHHEIADSHAPSIGVNKEGVIGVSWYERHDSCLDLFFTASLDGGKSFLPQVKISSATSCPDTPENKAAFQRFHAGGDYSGLTAASDGAFHVVWSDARTGVYQLRTATVRVKN